MKPCIFFDRDGTLIEERHYLSDPSQVALIAGAAEAVRLARQAGYLAVVLTNQSGVGRGYFTMKDVEAVHRRMMDLFAADGAFFDAIYVCPHAPGDNCPCRKPRAGLVELAARELQIDLPRSWMIGDKAADIELAKNARLRAARVLTGYGQAGAAQAGSLPAIMAKDVLGAVSRILAAEQQSRRSPPPGAETGTA